MQVFEGAICDFCSGSPVTRRYEAESFVDVETGPVRTQSVGDWGACAACAELIDSDRWEDLAERSTFTLEGAVGKMPPERRDKIKQYMRDLHQKFKYARSA